MHVLMVTSEATPFAKSGGLADAVSALSRALRRLGHDVRIVLPLYGSVATEGLSRQPKALRVSLGSTTGDAAVLEGVLPDSDVPVYFIEHHQYFDREGIYGSKAQPDYDDNPERFSFFSRAAFRLCEALGWMPDVLHAHDWPTALVPVYARYEEPAFASAVSILTIHNLGYQGVYHKGVFPGLGLPWELFHGAGFEYYDKVNLLKAGITCADRLSTVSPTYAREIQKPELGCTLDGLLRVRSASLVGILNGVDGGDWDPSTDNYLPARYSVDDMRGKAVCKAALQAEAGLPITPDKPLIGMVSRLTDQKGIGELFGPTYGSAASMCLDMDMQFVVQGTGETWCEAEIARLSERIPNFKARVGYSERFAHLIEAGADFFMMPSRYEPCGLNQMYSLRYGTLPIAHRTGGLADTISNFNQETGNGTGFLFDELTPRSIYDTTGWAVWAYYNKPEQLAVMQKRAMMQEFSWDGPAREYEALYHGSSTAIANRPGVVETAKGQEKKKRNKPNNKKA
ncbi:MAG: glycogen synthase GlgA [Spirochaetales bacterium]|nr:glycogen synthase GlgA [Spirochaetales bacterium]